MTNHGKREAQLSQRDRAMLCVHVYSTSFEMTPLSRRKSLWVFRCNCLYLVPFLRQSVLNNGVTLKSGLEVTEGHSHWYYLKAWVRFPIRIL